MSSTYPTTQDTFSTKANGDVIDASHIDNLQDSVLALEANVGVTNSADTSTIDYKLKNASSVNPGHKHTITNAMTDVVITTPSDGQALVYEAASSKWKNKTTASPDASDTVKGITKLSVTPAVANNPIAVGDNDSRLPTQNENDALVGTSGTAVSSSNKLVDNADTATSGANKVLRLDGTGKLPALDGSQLTNVASPTHLMGVCPVGFGSTSYTPFQLTSLHSGSTQYLYGSAYTASNAPRISTYTLSNGSFKKTAEVLTTGFGSNQKTGVCPLGSYVYVVADNGGGTKIVKRYDAGTLANETSMTISGTAITNPMIFTDGTYLYFNTSGSGTTFTKYSVSGTTITSVSTISLTSFPVSDVPVFSDGTYIYAPQTNTTSKDFYRWAIAGGSATSQASLYSNFMGSAASILSTGIFKVSGFSNTCQGIVFGQNFAYILDSALA